MITYRTGDLLDQPDLTHIAHQANLFHTFGAGLALSIARKWSRALEADKLTGYGDERKLGTFSFSVGTPNIINLYTQDGFGTDATDYEAMQKALEDLENLLLLEKHAPILGLPYGLGCGLAGGDWPTVSRIIEDCFGDSLIRCVIVRLP